MAQRRNAEHRQDGMQGHTQKTYTQKIGPQEKELWKKVIEQKVRGESDTIEPKKCPDEWKKSGDGSKDMQ